ncbi:MAG: HEAT repeat domain-containing protein [Candidatus Thorarchaeota archaeon]
MNSGSPSELPKIEAKKLREMRSISAALDSPDLGIMYSAAAKLMTYQTGTSLLPKAMSLLGTPDATLRRLVYRMAGRHVYGDYISELFNSMKNINPAEREQVLQGIEEKFETLGSPISSTEQKRWIDALSKVGQEHQATIFGIMAQLGKLGIDWAKKRIKDKIETISIGTISKLGSYPEPAKKDLIKTIAILSAKKKHELLPYLCEIVDSSTIGYLKPFLREGSWKERVHVARAAGNLGITSTTGIIMDLIADPDWRVKQELLEAINLQESRFSGILKILRYVVKDSHSRVRGQAERAILLLGITPCQGSKIEVQRKKIEKLYRSQLLKAASVNRDVDSRWLGVEVEEHPIPFIPEDSEAEEGVSLLDLKPEMKEDVEQEKPKLDLMAALLQARDAATPQQTVIEEQKDIDESDTGINSGLLPAEKFLLLLKRLTTDKTRGVSLARLKKNAGTVEMSEEEVEEVLIQLEKDGLVYRSSKGSIKRVDMEL